MFMVVKVFLTAGVEDIFTVVIVLVNNIQRLEEKQPYSRHF
jgi:hypothetical protein